VPARKQILRIFDRAYDKAARLQPGQTPTLTEEEDAVLLDAIDRYRRRKQAALGRFLQHLEEEGIDLPHTQAKLMFQQYWQEGRIS
jgi:hypothetical protein